MNSSATRPTTDGSARSRRETLRRGMEQLGMEPDPGQIELLLAYLELLVHWNRRFNLTAVRDPDDMVPRHLLDSLAALPWLVGDRVLDAGSGVAEVESRLAIALSEAVRNRNDQEALDRYNAARAADWRRLLSLDGDPVASDDADPWTAAHSGRILPCLPASGTDLAGLLSGIGLRFAK